MHLFLPVDAHKQGNKKIVPLHCLSPSLSQKPKNPKTDKTHTHGLPPDEKKRGDKPCDRRPSGYLAILPLCHDWTGVVALSFPFPPYKYQGTKKRTDEKKKKRTTKKKEKKEERNIREKEEERNMGEQSKEREGKKKEKK